jgi:drug/metabolite transporter, DME family
MGGLLLICVAAVLWGTVGVASRFMSNPDFADPAVIGFIRTFLGGGVLLTAAWALGTPTPPLRRLPWRGLLAFGIAGAVFQVCLFAAFHRVGVTVTVAVTVCGPVVLVAIGDALWRRCTPDARVCFAIAIASAGILVARPDPQAGAAAFRTVDGTGIGLLAAASISFAVLAVVARSMSNHLRPIRSAGLGLGATALALAGYVVLTRGPAGFHLTAPAGRDLLVLAYIGVAATGGAYLAFVLGMQLGRSAATSLAATLIEPGVAALLATIILGERLSRPESLGCLMMAVAMVMLCAAERRAGASASP